MSNTSLLVQEIAARITGDDATAQAAKIARKCNSALNSQIAALSAKEVDAEDALENATEALNNAKFPTEKFSNGQAYINAIQNAQSAVDAAEEDLADIRASQKYFAKLKKDLSASVKS